MRAWHTYRVKTGRPRKVSRLKNWNVKGFMSGAVHREVIQAETDMQAIAIAKHTWGLPVLRYGANKTTLGVRP